MQLAISLNDMTQEELLSLSDRIFDELKSRNNRGLEYGQKVLVKGKYADHPDFMPWARNSNYTQYVGTIAYVREPEVMKDENGLPYVVLRKTPKYGARFFAVHPDDIVVLGYVKLEEYKT